MIYFDNASTTKISDSSLESYIKASELFYNPSGLYKESSIVLGQIEEARRNILKSLKAKEKSALIFTGSASEANNSVLNACIVRKDRKYIFSAGEHSSIYSTAKFYKDLGFNVVFVPLNKNGSVNIDKLSAELDNTVALVSIIHVSNETGAINNIKEISKIVREKSPTAMFHADGVQALGKVEINLKALDVDYYTISAHKIHGPKGVGALYVANTNKFKPFIHGGGQEMNMRAGTENFPGIKAFETAIKELKIGDYSKQKQIITENLKGDYILVSDDNCVNNIISICFKGVRGETILHMLEEKGFLVGTGSACNSKAGFNRVLSEIVPQEYLGGAIRLSFEDVTVEECANLVKELGSAVEMYVAKFKGVFNGRTKASNNR